MPKKHMTVRLRCSLDNGKTTWSPGDCVSLPEDQALSLLEMGLAEKVEETAKRSASAPRAEERPVPEQQLQLMAAAQEQAEQSDESTPGNGDGSTEDASAEAQSHEGENNG